MVVEKDGGSWEDSTLHLEDPLLPADSENEGRQRSNDDATIQMVEVTAPADLAEGERFDTSHNGRTVTLVVPLGGVKRGDTFRVPEPTRVTKVVCPANVAGGAEIDVWLHGKKVTVIVPPGGAKRGETFEIPDPTSSDTPSSESSPPPPRERERRSRRARRPVPASLEAASGQEGQHNRLDNGFQGRTRRTTTATNDDDDNRRRWRDGLLDCFSLGFFHPSLCMSFWCPLIAVGQLLTRLKLDWLGKKLSRRSSNRSAILMLALMSLAAMKLDFFFSSLQANLGDTEAIVVARVLQGILSWGLFAFWLMVLYNVRMFVRERDGISRHEGCQFYLCCPTLLTAQLMRHTAYYPEHKGAYLTLDGLAQGESSDPPTNIV